MSLIMCSGFTWQYRFKRYNEIVRAADGKKGILQEINSKIAHINEKSEKNMIKPL